MLRQIEIVEVGPRDGLQNERNIMAFEDKHSMISNLVRAGIRRLEVGSFVNPSKVPQMAGTEQLVQALPDVTGVTYIGLVLNQRGLERALDTSVHEIGAVAIASDTFALKNQGQTAAESVRIAKAIAEQAITAGRAANVTISAAFGCPFEGEIAPDRIVEMALDLAEARPHEIAIADTIGVADPWRVVSLVEKIRSALPDMPLRAHFHNTRNTGMANAYAAIMAGVSRLDASLGGIGGCPFAPAATGNIPTEDLAYMLQRGGIEFGASLDKLLSAANWLSDRMEKNLPSMLPKAGQFPAQNQPSKTNTAA